MRAWDTERVARASGARVLARAAAGAEAGARITSMLSAPKFATSRTVLDAATRELEREKKLDRAAVLRVGERFGDPELGQGIARLERVDPKLRDNPRLAAKLAESGVVPELDWLARQLPEAQLTRFAAEVERAIRDTDGNKLADLVHRRTKELKR